MHNFVCNTYEGCPGSRQLCFRRPSTARLRSGALAPRWLRGTVEQLAQKYDHAAEYADKVRDVRRLARMYRQVQVHIANDTFAGVRQLFHQMKQWLRNPNVDQVTAGNVLALHRERRHDLGRPKKKGPRIGEGGLLVANGAPAPNR